MSSISFRLNLSDSSPGGRSTVRTTPVSTGDGSGSRKRRIVEHETTTSTSSLSRRDVSSSQAEYISVASGKGSIEVHEVDPDGKFVILCNTSDKVPLGLRDLLAQALL